jgi:WD40 repeat protein
LRIVHVRPKLHRRYDVKGLAYSPCGQFLLAGVERRLRDEWDPHSEGRLLLFDLYDPDAEPLVIVDRGFVAVAWSPAGDRLVGVSGARLLVTDPDFDVVSVQGLLFGKDATFDHTGRYVWITTNQFTTAGPFLYRYTFDERARWKLSMEVRSGGTRYISLALRPHDGLAALGGHDVVALGRLAPFEVVDAARQRGWVQHVAFSPNGRTLAAVSGWRVVLWDVSRDDAADFLRIVAELKGHEKEVTGIAFTPDGRWLLSASLDETVRLWNPVTGEPGPCLDLGLGAVRSVACAPDGMTAAVGGSGRKSIAVFDLE